VVFASQDNFVEFSLLEVRKNMRKRFFARNDKNKPEGKVAAPQEPAPITDLGESDFFDSLDGHATVVDFWAPWCNPCKTLHPVFEEIARNQATENVHFVRVNIDESPGLASALGIMSIPTLMLCDLGGNEVDRITGMPNRQRLDTFVAQAGSLTT